MSVGLILNLLNELNIYILKYTMRASGKHIIILFNEFDKFSNYLHKFIILFITFTKRTLNPYNAEFLKWKNPPFIFGTIHYHY